MVFGAALLVVLAGVAWISTIALRLDRAELEGRRLAAVEENVRLALWRLDSALLPLIARESARPPSDHAAGREHPEHVRQLFEIGADGAIGSVRGADILAALSAGANPGVPPRLAAMPAGTGTQAQKSLNEWQMRSASLDNCAPGPGAGAAPLTPVWVRGELLLARRVGPGALGPSAIQGAWLDWPELQRWLPATVADLLPAARLEPASAEDEMQRRLAALPLRLVPGPVEVRLEGQRSSVGLVLAVAWAGLLLAAAAVVALMAGTLSLSERRATFVSAVTHELRTPLTTLQTYSEMLADGKVTEPAKRQRYVETLHREALRLSHLVENVLAYSGIERGRQAVVIQPLSVHALFERSRERLAARAAQAGMALELTADEALVARGDAGPIDQILFNLVDNACKYGAGLVSLSAVARGDTIELRVRDQGAGVARDVRGRLFEPFSKSAERAAGGVPGVGLGLALSRRLARAMGGDLRLEAGARSDTGGDGGACFLLILRRAHAAPAPEPA